MVYVLRPIKTDADRQAYLNAVLDSLESAGGQRSRAFCPGASPPDNSCSPANKGAGDSYGFKTKVEESKDAWGKSTYTLPNGEVKKNYSVSLVDAETGGRASLKIGAYEDEASDFKPTATEVTIVSWHASPLQDIVDGGLEGAYKKNVGKGFGRRVMATVLETAIEHDADIVSVFAPSEHTQAVMEKYAADGLFTPIPASKAVYGDYYTDFTINKDKVPEFLAETKRRVKAAKRAFCPTGVGGGIDNSCSSKGGGSNIADITYVGSKEYAEAAAKQMGIKVDDAIKIVAGSGDDASVTISTGKRSGAISVSVTRPLAGVDRGITCDGKITNEGTPTKPSIVVDYELMSVPRQIRSDPEKRHAAGREFYRIMADGVDHARSIGASEVRLFAAGSGANSDQFRGYAIWPRMGFDAPLPFNVRQKLPKPLSAAKTVQDLHASREGTRWWRDNGIAMDLKLDLRDPSSRQMRTFDRFVKHFVRERRSEGVSTGDGWLSPDDESLIDEMWEEMWLESRAFCPGASPPDNSCSPANKGGGRPPPVPPDRSRLISDREAAKYKAESRDWLAENGVQLTVDFDPDFDPASTAATVDAVEAAVLGVEALSLAGIEPPQSINIGETSSPASAAQYDPDLDTITIRMNQDRERMRSNIRRNWLVGDPANVFNNLVIHETTHRDHWIAMGKDETLWEQRCGHYDFERQKKEAEIAGRPFRPSADLVREYAWDAKYRTGDATVDLPATRAIDIARRVSEYATADPLEFVAEVRTGVALGNTYDDDVMALYEDYDGPPLGRRKRR